MSLYVRVDDFPFTKPEEAWKHNLDSFKRFNALMSGHGVSYVLGVIPRWTTREDLEHLAACQNVEVALHGIDHDERFPNEFREHLTVKDIYQAIKGAVAPLDELCGPVDTYIPPHNVIDIRTLSALKHAGFKRVLGGPGTSQEAYGLSAQTIGVPIHLSEAPLEYGRSDELLERGSVKHLVHALQHRDVWLTLHLPWETNIGLEYLDRYLHGLKEAGVLYGQG